MFNILVNAFAMPMGRVQSFDGVSFHDCSCPQYHYYNDTLRLDNLVITAVSPHLPDLVVSHDPPTTSSSRRLHNHTFVFHEKSFNKSSSTKTSNLTSQVTNSTPNTQTTQSGSHSTQTPVGSSNGTSALTVTTRTVATQVDNTDTRNSSTFPDTNSRIRLTSRAAYRTGSPPVSSNRGGSQSFGFVPPFENAIHDDDNENEKSSEISILDTSDSVHQTQVESEETESPSIETIDEILVDVSRFPENLNSNFEDNNNSTFNSTSSTVTTNNRRNLSTSSTASPTTYDEGSISKFGKDPTVNFCKIDVSVNMDNLLRVRAPQSPAEDEKAMKDVDLHLKQMLAIRERLQTDPTYDSNSTLSEITPSGLSSNLIPLRSADNHLLHHGAHSTALTGDFLLHQNSDENRDRRDRSNFRLIHEMRKLRLRWELPPPIPPSVTTTSTCGCDHGRELLSVTRRGSAYDEAGDSEAVASAVMTKMGAELRKIADDFQMTHGMTSARSWKAMALLEPLWLRQRLSAPARQTLAITVTSVLCWRLFAELLSRLR